MRATVLIAALAGAGTLAFACKAQQRVSQLRDDGDDIMDANPDTSVVAYAELCKQELGITQPLPALSCLKGSEIPITVDGVRLTKETWPTFQKRCDAPHWLGGEEGCFPYDHIQRVDVGNPDVVAILNCRQKYFTNGLNNALNQDERAGLVATAAADAERKKFYDFYATFNDLGYILKNVKTGKTCFFTYFGGTYFGGHLAPPDQATMPDAETLYASLAEPKPPRDLFPESYWHVRAENRWLKPQATVDGNCVSCHDLGGFKHSPFIRQAEIVPSNKRTPYLLVGNVFQQKAREDKLMDVTTAPIDGEAQVCTSCHRMAAGGATCDQYIDWSTGKFSTKVWNLMSETARAQPARQWMPDGHDTVSFADYSTAYKKHIDAIKCCCANPKAIGCKSKRYGPTAAEVDANWTAGAGPAVCVQ